MAKLSFRMNQNPHSQLHRGSVISIVSLSALISLWHIMTEVNLNPDGYLYLDVAQAIVNGNWADAYSLYKWPFYSLVIAFTHQLTGLSLINSGFLLGIVFFNVLLVAYIKFLEKLGASPKQILIGCILFLIHNHLNDYRDMLIRDVGYWAFWFISILFLFDYLKKPTVLLALLWAVSILLAGLFRLEGFVFLACMPFAVFFCSSGNLPEKFKHTLTLFLPPALLLMVVYALASEYALEGQAYTLGRLGNFKVYFTLLMDWPVAYAAKMDALGFFIDDRVQPSGVFLMIIWTVVYYVVLTVNVLYMGCLLYGFFRYPKTVSLKGGSLFIFLVVIQTCIVLTHIWTHSHSMVRIYVPYVFITLLFLPFIVTKIWEELQGIRNNALKYYGLSLGLSIGLMAVAVDALIPLGASYSHVKEATLWLNDRLDGEDHILTNDLRRVSIHLEPTVTVKTLDQLLSSEERDSYDYVAIKLRRKQPQIYDKVTRQLGMPVTRFVNERNDSFLIYSTAKSRETVAVRD